MLLKILTSVLAAMAMFVCGCTITLQDEGSVRLTFGTQIGIESTSSTTSSKSMASIESPSFIDWLLGDSKKDEDKDKDKDDGTE